MTISKQYFIIVNGFIIQRDKSLTNLINDFNQHIKSDVQLNYQTIYHALERDSYYQQFYSTDGILQSMVIQKLL
jgi:hypothetical protein